MSLIFCGCSLTHGIGVEYYEAYPRLLQGENYGWRGSSNTEIFVQAAEALANPASSIVFVQISSPGRAKFYSSPDTTHYTKDHMPPRIDYLTEKKYKIFQEVYQILDSDFHQYWHLSKHMKILNDLSNLLNKKVFYLNGLLHIDPVFFETNIPSNLFSLNEVTREILEFDTNDDVTISTRLKFIQELFSVTPIENWISIERFPRSDIGSDGRHPGPESHKIMANKILKFLENKGLS
jgi:hypothetical protein